MKEFLRKKKEDIYGRRFMRYLRSTAVFLILLLVASVFAAPDWEAVIYTGQGTTYYGTSVTIDSILTVSADMVGVFVGDECRAVGNPSDSGSLYGLQINGNTGATETLLFRIWDASIDVICDVAETYEVTHEGDNLVQDINAISPVTTDTEITIDDAAVNQVTDFTVEVESYQGIEVGWSINEIEFEVHYTNSIIDYSGYDSTGCLSSGNTVTITDSSTFITVNITSASTISGLDPIIGLEFSPQGIGGSSSLDLQNFTYTDTSDASHSITNLIDGTATITYENFEPYVSTEIPNQNKGEDFDVYVLNLNDYFSDDNGDEISYSAEFTDTKIGISITDSTLTLTSVSNWYGETSVTITADDQYSRATIADTFDVIITSVNDAPVIVLPDSFTFVEDGTLEVDFSSYISDVDEDAIVLTYSNNTNVTVSIDVHTVTFGTVANFDSSEVITFTVNDNQGRATDSDTVEIIVTSDNDAPEITDYIPVDLNMNIPVGDSEDFSITVSDIDTDSGSLDYNWYVNTVLQAEATSSFNYTFSSNGNYTIKGEVSDGEFTDDVTWSVFAYVGSASLDSSQVSIQDQTISNGSALIFDVLSSFIDDTWDVISFSFDLAFDSTLVDYASIANGAISTGGTFDVTNNGNSLSVDYSGGDVVGAGAIATMTFNTLAPGGFTLTLSNFLYNATAISDLTNGVITIENDAPIVSLAIDDFEKFEDFNSYNFDLDDHFSDPNGDILSYGIEYTNTEIAISLNETNGILTIDSLDDWFGISVVTVTATDEYSESISDDFLVDVSSINDEPVIISPIDDMNKIEDFDLFTIDLDTVFSDVEDSVLDYSYILVSGQVGLEISGSTLSISSVENWNGTANIEITATDDEISLP